MTATHKSILFYLLIFTCGKPSFRFVYDYNMLMPTHFTGSLP